MREENIRASRKARVDLIYTKRTPVHTAVKGGESFCYLFDKVIVALMFS